MIRFKGLLFFTPTLLVVGLSLVACDKSTPDEPDGFELVKYNPVAVTKANNIVTWAHIMPWFETKETSENSRWGQHWTMSTQNPDNMDQNGRRDIASYFYPLTGPYASGDKDIIEYQLLLMKYSGIDGILIDWYGSTNWNDYGSNRKNSEAIIDLLDEVGLWFAIVYEDRTIQNVVAYDNTTDRISAAQADMIYLEENYFSNQQYIKIDNKPLLLVFGPEEFHQSSEWEEIFTAFTSAPCFITLNGTTSQTAPLSSGEYIWVDNSSLDNKYKTMSKFDTFIGGAYPGFKDFYGEGGWGQSFSWSIDFNNGETLRQNLQKAKNAQVDYVQLITWNDYGEGTMIEPTQEFEYSLLGIVQEFTGVSYTTADLEKIMDLYSLRKSNSGNSSNQKYLDQAFYYLVSLQQEKAYQLIDSLKTIQ